MATSKAHLKKVSPIKTMTANEQALVEEVSGLSLATLEDPNYPKVKVLTAMGWVLAKRTNPALTLLEYGEKTLEEITEELGISEEDA